MKNIYLNKLFEKIYKKWWIILASILFFVCLFLYLAHDNLQLMVEEPELTDITPSAEYLAALESYDAAIMETQESIKIVEKQMEKQQHYCDNSIYMKLDSDKYYIASMFYTLEGAGDYTQYILNLLTMYMNVNHMGTVVEQQLPEVNSEYLSESVSCSVIGYSLYVTVTYFDEEGARNIRNAIESDLQERIDQFFAEHDMPEGCKWKKIDEDIAVVGDSSILNIQNTNRNNLKSYQTNQADLLRKVAELQVAKQNYIDSFNSDQADSVSDKAVVSPQIVLIRFGVIGFLVGLLLPIVCFLIIVVVDDRIKEEKELNRFGLISMGSLTDCAMFDNISVLVKKQHLERVFFNILPGSKEPAICKEQVTKMSSQLEIETYCGQLHKSMENSFKEFLSADGSILVIDLKHTTYSQIQEQMQICQRLDIPVLGCIQMP